MLVTEGLITRTGAPTDHHLPRGMLIAEISTQINQTQVLTLHRV